VISRCLEALYALDWPSDQLEIIVVNNGSTDGTAHVLQGWAERGVTIITLPRNAGFAGGNNPGILRARGDWIILLNDDTEVHRDWLRVLMKHAESRPDAGLLGSLLVYGDRHTVQHAGGVVQPNALTNHIGSGQELATQHRRVRECDYVTGAAIAIRRDVVRAVGLLDPGYWPIYFEEIDYCWRARRAGFVILQTPALCVHHESRTTQAWSPGFLRKYHRNRLRYVVMNFGPRRTTAWSRAEVRWLQNNWNVLPRRLLLEVYLKALFLLPGWVAKRFAPQLFAKERMPRKQ
jgi:O-antigen biosynthesis protein